MAPCKANSPRALAVVPATTYSCPCPREFVPVAWRLSSPVQIVLDSLVELQTCCMQKCFFSRGNNLQQRGCKDLPKICPKLHAFPDTRRIYGQLAYSIGKPKSKPNNKNTPRTHYCRASAVCSSSAKETSGSRVSYCTSWPFGAVG